MASLSRCLVPMMIAGDHEELSGCNNNSDEILQQQDEEDFALWGADSPLPLDENNKASLSTSSSLQQALRQRMAALQQGIGKRYVCRTQMGFLNIHETPEDPYKTDNVVGRLVDGDIVVSTGPRQGDWIRHDGGGWSIAVHGGFVWLEELQE